MDDQGDEDVITYGEEVEGVFDQVDAYAFHGSPLGGLTLKDYSEFLVTVTTE